MTLVFVFFVLLYHTVKLQRFYRYFDSVKRFTVDYTTIPPVEHLRFMENLWYIKRLENYNIQYARVVLFIYIYILHTLFFPKAHDAYVGNTARCCTMYHLNVHNQ